MTEEQLKRLEDELAKCVVSVRYDDNQHEVIIPNRPNSGVVTGGLPLPRQFEGSVLGLLMTRRDTDKQP